MSRKIGKSMEDYKRLNECVEIIEFKIKNNFPITRGLLNYCYGYFGENKEKEKHE